MICVHGTIFTAHSCYANSTSPHVLACTQPFGWCCRCWLSGSPHWKSQPPVCVYTHMFVFPSSLPSAAGVKSQLTLRSLKAIHSSVTGIGEEGLPFLSWVPANWREISTEQKDRGLPQHVHQPTNREKDNYKKMWTIPWRTETVR